MVLTAVLASVEGLREVDSFARLETSSSVCDFDDRIVAFGIHNYLGAALAGCVALGVC